MRSGTGESALDESRRTLDAPIGREAARDERTARLAVVVPAVGAPPELKLAVASLRRQSPALEIAVVNSGGGDAAAVLGDLASGLRVINRAERLLPGAARNLGIAATRAPFVAFLAADCVAAEEWARARLDRHLAGTPAVACALLPHRPWNLFAWASHIALFVRRLPGTPEGETLRYGASFARPLFDQYGLFREDLRIGEDTEFIARLPERLRPVWTPGVVTMHATPTTPGRMLRDQLERGRRRAEANPSAAAFSPAARLAVRRFARNAALSVRATRGPHRWLSVASWPLLACCIGAYALGMARAGRQ